MPEARDDRRGHRNPERVNLRARALRSSGIQLSSQAVKLILGVGSVMILARLLTPEDYGLLAMAATLTAFIASFRDFGLPMAAVQREDLDDHTLSRLFWLSQRINVATVGAVVLLAPITAWFYGEPRLTGIILIEATALLLLGVTFMHEGLLWRQLKFGRIMLIDVGAMLGGIVLAIVLAWRGAGYWALVGQIFATHALRSGGYWLACRWRPVAWSEGATSSGFTAMVKYGGYYTGGRLLAHVGRNLDRVLIGFLHGTTEMGLYNNAYRWARFPTDQIYDPLRGVAVAAFSRVQDDPAAYRAAVRQSLLALYAVVVPVPVFMAMEAERTLLVLLGDQWLEAVPYFQLLCLAAAAMGVEKMTKWVYLSEGRTRAFYSWQWVYMVVMIAAVSVGAWRQGPYGVAVGYTLGTCLLAWPSVAYCLSASPIGQRDVLRAAARPVVATLGGAVAVWLMRPVLLPIGSAWVVLLVSGLLFGSLYMLIWTVAPGGRRALADVASLAREILPGSTS